MSQMRRCLAAATVISCAACRREASPPAGEYLFVWAGDSAGASSDFLGVIDTSPSSPTYGLVVASLPTGVAGTHPHHTEAVLAANTPRMVGVVPAEADRLLEELVVFGTPVEVRQRLARWFEAGADSVCLLLPPHLTTAQIDFTLDAFAAESAPGGAGLGRA